MARIKLGNDFDSYNDYINLEWDKFETEPERYASVAEAVILNEIKRVLDIGCGAGQEMLPFIDSGAFGVGVDITPFVGQIGKLKFSEKNLQNHVGFVNCSGAELPFSDQSFDAIICRGALMYMNVLKTLDEISRVLAVNGKLFLMVQAPNYYWWKMFEGFKRHDIKVSVHSVRTLLNGLWFSISGRQAYNKLTAGGETFVSRKILERDLKRLNLEILKEMPDSNRQTPSFLIARIK
jgi:ubiquinone/menaquinone biosynthesis C-methylase UbiE